MKSDHPDAFVPEAMRDSKPQVKQMDASCLQPMQHTIAHMQKR